jgi:hypothetical protein
MVRLVSRNAFLVTFCYSALVGILLIAAGHVADAEGAGLALWFIGFPWDLALNYQESWMHYFFAVGLNVATVYVFVLALLKVFSSRNRANS